MSGNSVPDAIAVTHRPPARRNGAASDPPAGAALTKTGTGKTKAPLYAGIGAGLLALAVGAFFLFKPKPESMTKAPVDAAQPSGASLDRLGRS